MDRRLVSALKEFEALLPTGDAVSATVWSNGNGHLWSSSGAEFYHFASVEMACEYMEAAIQKSKLAVAA